MNPFFSVIVATCRGSYPFLRFPKRHVIENIIENCKKQTCQDFELIIVDLLYDYRREEVAALCNNVSFPVLHVKDKSSIFRDLKLIRIAAAKNTGLLYARGKCVIFSDDGQDWSKDAFERIRPWGERGVGATCRLHRDKGDGPYEEDSRWAAYGINGSDRTKTVRADGVGYLGGTLSMVPLKAALKCNGWDEMFDGSRQLEDSDMAMRLGTTGLQIALEGHPRVVEHELSGCAHGEVETGFFVKCNGAYIYPIWDRGKQSRTRANNKLLTEPQLDSFMRGKCWKLDGEGHCSVSGDLCEEEWDDRELIDIYRDERLVFDLEKMRISRSWEKVDQDPLLR